MKVLLEIVLSIVLHPIAFVLVVVNLVGRRDLSILPKILWGLVSLVWGVGPILYVLLGDGALW